MKQCLKINSCLILHWRSQSRRNVTIQKEELKNRGNIAHFVLSFFLFCTKIQEALRLFMELSLSRRDKTDSGVRESGRSC
jgi:hypothetical protein